MRVVLFVSLMLILVGVVTAEPVSAASILIKVDELGNASGGATYVAGSGTNTTPLTYTLPFVPRTGAVQLCERQQGSGCGDDSDVILFRNDAGVGHLVFYSLHTSSDGAEVGNLADQYPSYPSNLNIQNQNQLVEGAEGTNIGVSYHPTIGLPGFNASQDVTYHFYSDGPIPNPEPTTFLLWGTAAVGLGLVGWRRRRAS
jgi:MYXO-CTERM domain-containing protein